MMDPEYYFREYNGICPVDDVNSYDPDGSTSTQDKGRIGPSASKPFGCGISDREGKD